MNEFYDVRTIFKGCHFICLREMLFPVLKYTWEVDIDLHGFVTSHGVWSPEQRSSFIGETYEGLWFSEQDFGIFFKQMEKFFSFLVAIFQVQTF